MKRSAKTGVEMLSGFGLNAFSNADLDSLHYATLEVFQNTGIKVESKEAAEIFHSAGASVEYVKDYAIVKIPPHVVEDCIRWAARPMVFYGRDPEDDFIAEPNRVGFSTFGECVKVIDPVTREVRASVKEDCANITLIADYIDEIAVLERPCCSTDKPAPTQPLHNFEAIVTNTSKPVFIGPVNGQNCHKMVDMAAACVGGMENFKKRPFLNFFACPTSPLTLVKDCCDIIVEGAKLGAGLAFIPMALSGATGPATLAGTLVQHNVEVLSAIILAQLVEKGTRCVYCSISTMMDLRMMIGAVGCPELGLLSSGAAKLAQYYRLPSWIGCGLSDSKLPDAQAGYEYAINATVGALAGANIVYGAGAIESCLTQDYAKLVMDAEAMRHIKKIIKGIEITDETLALDVIHKVGPGGEFMTHEHTYQHMREGSQTKIFSRQSRDAWVADGSKDATGRAYEEVLNILKNHKPKPLPAGAAETMQNIIADYEEELGLNKK